MIALASSLTLGVRFYSQSLMKSTWVVMSRTTSSWIVISEMKRSPWQILLCLESLLWGYYPSLQVSKSGKWSVKALWCQTSSTSSLCMGGGGFSDYLLFILQVIQNTAARCVTRLGWQTRVSVLLLQCGWLIDRKPVYLYDQISKEFHQRTRKLN